MDNITHSLFGIATAKFVNAKVNKNKDKRTTYFLYFISIFAANFPDLDILMSIVDPGPLGYLLHHRGHTHTFLYLIPQVLLLFGLSIFGFKIKDKKVILWGLGLVSVNMVLHIFLDYQNSYGVHPFAPFNSKWFYNDNLFIIEPLLWFTMLPMLFTPIPPLWKGELWTQGYGRIRKNVTWVLALGFFMMVLVAAYRATYLSGFTFVMLGLIFIIYMSILNRKSDVTKSLVALISAAVIMQTFAVARTLAYKSVYEFESHSLHAKSVADTEALSKTSRGENADLSVQTAEVVPKIFDVILSPLPANPFCWKFLTVVSNQKTNYLIRTGVYQNSNFSLGACPDAAYQRVHQGRNAHETNPVYVESTYSSSLQMLTEDLGSEALNCKRDQWLQFVRAPFREQMHVYKDLRFERESNFTKIDVNDPKVRCVRFKVPWVPPRQDLIEITKPNS